MTGTRRSIVICCTILAALQSVASAQANPPVLHVTRDLLISAASNDLSPINWIAPFRDSTIAVGQEQDHLVRFFDRGGKSLGTFGRAGEGPGEFARPEASGWLGDTLWVSDYARSRFTLISEDRKLLRTVPSARGMRSAERDTSDYVQAAISLGLYADGTQLMTGVLPANDDPHLPAWARIKANTGSRVAIGRVTATGVLIRPIAFAPFDQCGLDRSPLGRLCQRPMATIGPTSDRVVMTYDAKSTGKTGSFAVVAIGEHADTLFLHRYGFMPQPIPSHLLDSLAALAAAGPKTPQMRGMASARPHPTFFPPLTKIVIGRDGTVWIEMRVTTAGKPYLVLDPKGNLIGSALFPANVTVLAANRTTAWGTMKDEDDVESVVRYKIGG